MGGALPRRRAASARDPQVSAAPASVSVAAPRADLPVVDVLQVHVQRSLPDVPLWRLDCSFEDQSGLAGLQRAFELTTS